MPENLRANQLVNVSKPLRAKSDKVTTLNARKSSSTKQRRSERIYIHDAFQRDRCPRVRHMHKDAMVDQYPHQLKKLKKV